MKRLQYALLVSSFGALLCIGMMVHLMVRHAQAAAPSAPDRPVIGFIELPSESEWRSMANRSVKQAAEQNQIQLLTVAANKTQDSQKEALRALIAYGVDAIIFSPVIAKGWDSVLKEAKDARIPIILSDSQLDTAVEDAVYAYVGTDYLAQGAAAAAYLTAKYGDAFPVEIVEFSGPGGSAVSAGLSGGVRRGLGAQPQFQIVYTASAKDMLSKSRELFSSFLTSGRGQPSADVFIGFNDAMTCGAVEAIEASGLEPGTDICIVSFGGEEQTFQLLAAGKINCIVSIPPEQGALLIETALETIRTGRPAGTRFVEWHVFTAEAYAET